MLCEPAMDAVWVPLASLCVCLRCGVISRTELPSPVVTSEVRMAYFSSRANLRRYFKAFREAADGTIRLPWSLSCQPVQRKIQLYRQSLLKHSFAGSTATNILFTANSQISNLCTLRCLLELTVSGTANVPRTNGDLAALATARPQRKMCKMEEINANGGPLSAWIVSLRFATSGRLHPTHRPECRTDEHEGHPAVASASVKGKTEPV